MCERRRLSRVRPFYPICNPAFAPPPSAPFPNKKTREYLWGRVWRRGPSFLFCCAVGNRAHYRERAQTPDRKQRCFRKHPAALADAVNMGVLQARQDKKRRAMEDTRLITYGEAVGYRLDIFFFFSFVCQFPMLPWDQLATFNMQPWRTPCPWWFPYPRWSPYPWWTPYSWRTLCIWWIP